MIRGPYFERPDELPPAGNPSPTPEPTPEPRRSTRHIACGYCGCHLTPTGEDVLKMSDQARAWRDADERHSLDEKRIAELEKSVRDLQAQLRERETRREPRSVFAD